MKGAKVATLLVALCVSHGAWAQERHFDLSSMDAVHGIPEFARQAGIQIVAPADDLGGASTPAIRGDFDVRVALKKLLTGTDLEIISDDGAVITLRKRLKATKQTGILESGNAQRLASAAIVSGAAVGDSSEPANAYGLAEIVVTAQKREERLQDIPLSVTAIGQAQFQGLGAKTLDDIARTVPGLVLEDSGFGYASPIIRGIAQGGGAQGGGSQGGGAAATVGIYVDDTPIEIDNPPGGALVGNANLELYDLDRVEVLRGPQGTLYGGSAMGGTIRYITPQASLSGTTGRVTGEVSGTDDGNPNFNVGAALGTPIIDGVLGFRGSLYVREAGGYVDRVSRDSGQISGQNINNAFTGQAHTNFLWQVSPEFSAALNLIYQGESNDDLPMFNPMLRSFEQNFVVPQKGHDNFFLPSVTINYDFGVAKLTSVTSYLDRNQAQILDYSTFVPELLTGQSIAPGFTDYISAAEWSDTQRNISEEIRLTSTGDNKLQWLVGAFYAHDRHYVNFPLYEPGFPALINTLFGSPDALGPQLPGSVSYLDLEISTQKQTAGFGELTYEIIHGLKLTGGVRVSHTEYGFSQLQNGPLNGGLTEGSGSQAAHSVSPKGALSYNLTPDTLVYASAAKGFRNGGPNSPIPLQLCASDLATATGGKPPPETYTPDTVWSYELGFKTLSFDRRLSLNASLYRIDWSDIQSLVNLPSCAFSYVTNFGTATSKGAEIELTLTPIKGLTMGVTASYTDARYTSDVLGAPNPNTGVRGTYVLSGDRIDGIPRWTDSFNLEYQVSLTSELAGYVRGDYQYQGSRLNAALPGRIGYNATFYDRFFPLTSYSYGSIRMGVRSHAWDVSAFVNNVANARPVIASESITSPVLQNATEETLRPRVVGLTVERRF